MSPIRLTHRKAATFPRIKKARGVLSRSFMALVRPPSVIVRVVGEKEPKARAGFLTLHHYEIVTERDGNKTSRPIDYDVVTRKYMDAAVMAAHYETNGNRFVILRSCVRPPVALRFGDGNQWELPAGLIE